MSQTTDTLLAPTGDPKPWPQSWLGFKMVDQATVDEAAAQSLPSEQALSGRVWCVLYGADGEPFYVAGIVVAATFTASKVKYSVAFAVSPQPKEGVTLYAVVDNINSELLVGELPGSEGVFDAVGDSVGALLPGAAVVLDAIDAQVASQIAAALAQKVEALQAAVDDPLAAVTLAGEVITLAQQVAALADEPMPDPLAAARARVQSDPAFRRLTADFTRSLAVIKGVDEGTEKGWDRALFVSSIVGKIKTQAKNDPQLAALLLAWLDAAQAKWSKPAITARNGVWSAVPDWQQYTPLFISAAPAPAATPPVPVASVKGDELGQFEPTEEGKRQLRGAAKSYFQDKLLGTRVFNASLGGDIEFNKNGMKKMLSFTADARKLKLIPVLPSILASGTDVRKLPYREGDSGIVAVHVLKADVDLDGSSLNVRVIVKERADGSFFYDHSVNKEDLGGNAEILDSADAAELSLLALLCPEPSAQQVLLDSVGSSGDVFNLFIEGEAPEVVAPDTEQPDDAQIPVEEHATEAQGRAALTRLKAWMPRAQFNAIQSAMNGEEAQFFFDKMVEMSSLIAKMPKTYEQDGMGHKAIVSLHYFRGSSDWYITEKDREGKGTEQAFGLAVLNGDRQNAELGYISIDELVEHNVELDLYWDKKTVGMVKNAIDAADQDTATTHSAQFESYRVYIEAERAAGRVIAPAMMEQIRMDERLNDGEASELEIMAALKPAAPPEPVPQPVPQPKPTVNMETLIKIAADSIGQLARINVYRVLNEAGDQRAALASYIATQRPDLAEEVASVMAEEWPDLNWSTSASPSPVAKVELPGGGDGSGAAGAQANSQRAADVEFLSGVVSQNVDMWADELAERIEKIGEAYAGDGEIEALWGQAVESYTNYMASAMTAA